MNVIMIRGLLKYHCRFRTGISVNITRGYLKSKKAPRPKIQLKSDLKIQWIWPGKQAIWDPEECGDREGMPAMNLNRPILSMEGSNELESAGRDVRKLFSLYYHPHNESKKLYCNDLMVKTQMYEGDTASREVRIAQDTGMIRNLQRHFKEFPQDRRAKAMLNIMVQKRKKKLKLLRREDYKKFEWTLEQLNLEYKPKVVERILPIRKENMRRLTRIHCEKMEEDKIKAYERELEEQKLPFLQEKLETFQWIKKEENKLNLQSTISDKDINDIQEKVKQLKIVKENRDKIRQEETKDSWK